MIISLYRLHLCRGLQNPLVLILEPGAERVKNAIAETAIPENRGAKKCAVPSPGFFIKYPAGMESDIIPERQKAPDDGPFKKLNP
jgi:hypothetical protein